MNLNKQKRRKRNRSWFFFFFLTIGHGFESGIPESLLYTSTFTLDNV